jgi:hypothetical protein
MLEYWKDSRQPHDNVEAMWNSKSIPRTLWGALEYDSEPHELLVKMATDEKSNLHVNLQVKVLSVGLGTLTR